MPYRWIAFDAVETLIYPEPSVSASYAAIGQRYGSRLTMSEIRTKFSSAFTESVTACLSIHDGEILTSEAQEFARWRWIVERVFPDVSDADRCFAELYEHFAQPKNWRVYDDVAETLEQWRQQGVRLALASNFDRRLHALCQAFPELKLFDQVLISTEAGVCKPSPRFYQTLLQQCDCQPEELLMVGDDPELDVAAPLRSGIAALHLDREGTASGSTTIRSLTDTLTRTAQVRPTP